jgi:hypothetical protein
VKGAEPAQKKPAGIGSFAKSTKVKPSAFVAQTSIPFWMTRSAPKAEAAELKTTRSLSVYSTARRKAPSGDGS